MNSVQSRYSPEAYEVIAQQTTKDLAPAIATREALGQNLTLGHEQIKYASQEIVHATIRHLDAICTKNVFYKTSLNQGQMSQGLVKVLKDNLYVKIKALTDTNEPVPQDLINTINMFINEYEIQSKTYSNLKTNNIEGLGIEGITYSNAA